MRDSSIWAVTSYFNPAGYRRRRENFRIFRRRLGIPLLAVELSSDGGFELDDGDAEILVRLDGGDILWQKERLLNVGLCTLPPECRTVACVDCDVLFGSEDWARRAEALIERYPVIQPFSRVQHLRQDWSPATDPAASGEWAQDSIAFAMSHGDPALLGTLTQRCSGAPSSGFAWVLRRDLAQRCGLYDGCITGGGDSALACAAWGDFEAVIHMHRMNAHQEGYYRRWAHAFNKAVRGRVGCVEGELFHLWHGSLRDRQASERHLALQPFGFDPLRDVVQHASGGWRWNSDKPGLHACLRAYFSARKEDG